MKRFLTYAALLACSAVHAGTGSLDALRTAFVRASTASYAPDRQFAERFIECSDSGRANDVLLLQLYMSVHLPAEEVRRLLGLIDEQGRWSDIDYADRTRGRWQPTLHLTRLYALAKLWADPGSESYRSQRLRDVLHAGIGLWLRIDPRCPNWWHNEIGVPKKLTAILLMLGDEATPEEIAGGLRILKRSQFGRTGQNKVWLAGNNLMKGLLTSGPATLSPRRSGSPRARASSRTGRSTSTVRKFSSATTDWPTPRASRSGSGCWRVRPMPSRRSSTTSCGGC